MSLEEIKAKLINYVAVDVQATASVLPDALKLSKSLGLIPGQCLGNSYNAAKKRNAKIIEGIVLVYVDGQLEGAFGHCWNKINGMHFDLTLSYAQPAEVLEISGNKSFRYFEKYEASHRKYYKKSDGKELNWFTKSLDFGKELKNLGSEKLSELFPI